MAAVLAALRRRTAADYVRIRGAQGYVDSARQLFDAQLEGTTTWKVHDVLFADSCMHGERFVLPRRAFVHANVSLEYEC